MKLRNLAILCFIALAALLYGCGSATSEETSGQEAPTAENPATNQGTDAASPTDDTSNGGTPATGNPATDTTAPTISTVAPVDDAVSVVIDTTVTMTFNEAMDRTSVEGAFTITDGAAVNGTFSWTDDNTAVFTPSATLAFLTTYTITLSTAAKDKAGNTLASEFISNFTTEDRYISLLLDGVDDKAKFDGLIFPTGPNTSLTVEAWVYPTANKNMVAVSDNAYVLGVAHGVDGPGIWIVARRSSCGTSRNEMSGGSLALNQWNHIAMIYDKDSTRLGFAINGMPFLPTFFTGDFCSDLSYKFGIGNYNSAIGPIDQGFTGRINEVRVSNIARYNDNFTPEDTFTPDANTIGLWHFDEPVDSISFSDSSGNGYTLMAVGDAKTGR